MIFVLSDTHVPDRMVELPRKLTELIRPEDTIFHAGDFICWDFFEQLSERATVHAVYGNMDSAKVRRFLPQKKVVNIQGKRIGIIHGFGSPIDLVDRVYEEMDRDCDVLIFGHSHVPYNRKMGHTLIFNPGSASGNMIPPFDATYGVLTIEDDLVGAKVENL